MSMLKGAFVLLFGGFLCCASAQTEYQVSPAAGEWDKTYDITVRHPNCGSQKPPAATLELPAGFKLRLFDVGGTECLLTGKLEVQHGASNDVVLLRVKDAAGKILGIAPFQVTSVLPGPTPPGLGQQVDVMWGVLPKNICKDNFGHEIANNYFCIEVVIGNNSGYDLQIAALGFSVPSLVSGASRGIVPVSGNLIARGSLERGQDTGLRNYTLRVIKALGPILTGFTPFFKNTGSQASFSTGVDIFSNPLEKGYELAIPDLTLSQLNRLDAQMLRDGMIISNNSQRRTMVFLPKRYLKVALSNDDDLNDPAKVRVALGEMVLEGLPVEYKARIRVVSAPAEDRKPNWKTVTFEQPAPSAKNLQAVQEISIVLTGENLADAALEVPADIQKYLSGEATSHPPDSLDLKIRVATNTPAGNYQVLIRNSAGATPLQIEIKP